MQDYNAKHAQLKLLPRYKVKTEGEAVCIGYCTLTQKEKWGRGAPQNFGVSRVIFCNGWG